MKKGEKFKVEQRDYKLMLLAVELEFGRYRDIPESHRATPLVQTLERVRHKLPILAATNEDIQLTDDELAAVLFCLKMETERYGGLHESERPDDINRMIDVKWAVYDIVKGGSR